MIEYLHRPRFTTSRLPVGKDCSIEACDDSYVIWLNTVEDWLSYFLVDGHLASVWSKHSVKSKLIFVFVASHLPYYYSLQLFVWSSQRILRSISLHGRFQFCSTVEADRRLVYCNLGTLLYSISSRMLHPVKTSLAGDNPRTFKLLPRVGLFGEGLAAHRQATTTLALISNVDLVNADISVLLLFTIWHLLTVFLYRWLFTLTLLLFWMMQTIWSRSVSSLYF